MKERMRNGKIKWIVLILFVVILLEIMAFACFFMGYSAAKRGEMGQQGVTATVATEATTTESFEATSQQRVEARTSEEVTQERNNTEETTTEVVIPGPVDDADFVKVKDYIPNIVIDLKYATTDNFTGCQIYDFEEAYLRYGTVKKLMLVQEELNKEGLSLKIWDAFRPVSAQFSLWEICPDSTYVANPNTGYSSHSTGNTVDITLVTLDGRELRMPTGFDDFSGLADRDYSDCQEETKSNALLLQNVMFKWKKRYTYVIMVVLLWLVSIFYVIYR